MTDLSTVAMLASFTSSKWAARKTDQKVNREIALAHLTDEKVTTVRKDLMPMDAPSYDAIGTAYTVAYEFHKGNTLPWLDKGARILPAANFVPYSDTMRSLISTCEDAVRVFLVEYPTLRETARKYLNGMYNERDYPSLAKMTSLFRFEVRFFPLPDGNDFRVNLSADTVSAIRTQIEQSGKDALRDAMADVNGRLLDALNAMYSRLSQPDGIFRDTLFTNLSELVDLVPRLNLTNDPLLTGRCEEIKARILSVCSPETARRNPEERAGVAAEVARIAEMMR